MTEDIAAGAGVSEGTPLPAHAGQPTRDAPARVCWCGAKSTTNVGRFDLESAPASEMKEGPVLVRCDGCGVLALYPQPTDEELAAAYSKDYYGKTGQKFVGPIAALVRTFQDGRARAVGRRVPVGGRVLDVGCGNAGFLRRMHERGYVVEGSEWNARSAERVPKDPAIPVHVGDLLDLDLQAQSYDAITLWHVFEHVRRPYETLLKIKSLLRPGGWLFLAVPNAGSAQARRYGLHWFHHDPPRHLFGFGLTSLAPLLEGAGFHIQSTSTYSFEQNPFGEIQSALNSRGSFPRDRLYDRLKGVDSARTGLSDLARMTVLLLPALLRSTIESARNDGATLTIEARLVLKT
jgi:SAM-dependent methyltransferase